MPEPKAYNGARIVKKLENVPWDIKQYFRSARVPEAERVTITSTYLEGYAKLWWWSKLQEDAEAQQPVIEIWDTLKRELKGQFLPKNSSQTKAKRRNLQEKKSSGCFICDGPHRAKDCLRHEKLNALVKEVEGDSSKPLAGEVSEVRINSLQLLNNTKVAVGEEPVDKEMLESILRGEFYQE